MTGEHGLEMRGELSPFLRACIGVAIVCIAAAPLIWALCKGLASLVTAIRWW